MGNTNENEKGRGLSDGSEHVDPDQFEAAFSDPATAEGFGVEDVAVPPVRVSSNDESEEEEPAYDRHDDEDSW